MNDFVISSLEKLKEKNIPNPEIDLRILLNYSKYCKNDIKFCVRNDICNTAVIISISIGAYNEK